MCDNRTVLHRTVLHWLCGIRIVLHSDCEITGVYFTLCHNMSVLHSYYVITGLCCTLTVVQDCTPLWLCVNRAILHSDCVSQECTALWLWEQGCIALCVVQNYNPHWLYDNRIVLHSKVNLQLPLSCKPRPCVIIRQCNQYSWLPMSSIIRRLWTPLVMLRQSGTKWLQFIAPGVQSEATITLTPGNLGEVVEIFKFVIFHLISGILFLKKFQHNKVNRILVDSLLKQEDRT